MSLISSLTSYDDVTLLLLSGLILTVTAGIVSRSEPLAHPLVLGQQSEPSKVRRPTESAVYRNYGVGMYMPLPTRPKREVQTVNNFVQAEANHERILFGVKTTNAELQDRISTLGAGLVRKLNLAPRDSSVLMLLDDSFEYLVSVLALSACSVTPITISHLQLLNPVLSVHPPSAIIVQSRFLHTLLEQLADEKEAGLHLIVVGEIDDLALSHARKTGIQLIPWEDVLKSGAEPLNLSTSDLPTSNDVFMISYYADDIGQPKAVQFTHQNMTAAVVSNRALFAVSTPVSSSDRVLSSFSMNTPFGMGVLFQALWEGASFSAKPNIGLFKSESDKAEDSVFAAVASSRPTILYTLPSELASLSSNVLTTAKGSFLYTLAWKRKMGALLEGSLNRTTPWDRVVFEEARAKWSLSDLRSVVTAGEPSDPSTQAICSIAMSVPISRAHIYSLSASPILASHPLDLQRHFPATGGSQMSKDPLHVGPPAPSVEVKLVGVSENDIEAGNDPRGELLIRGTSVGTPVSESTVPYSDGWLPTGERAIVQSNGTFKVVGRQRRTTGP
ncbi:acetyl-CoA synthetase [Rhizoctonia solani AG-3 Rhs1AP]|uniref:Acetyl-CoA synthetase n=2 Tax=Rhizoctonia solani AG-3 TaxID=1086053 RepID=A0A074T0H1_9AGAM|nr:acetyl-CoA synthetase [Rhizoctonia solani AG-3 Rhs1AP]KEP55552.1 acetyl-CoA synthetase [Rhizoctonia solani 123E]